MWLAGVIKVYEQFNFKSWARWCWFAGILNSWGKVTVFQHFLFFVYLHNVLGSSFNWLVFVIGVSPVQFNSSCWVLVTCMSCLVADIAHQILIFLNLIVLYFAALSKWPAVIILISICNKLLIDYCLFIIQSRAQFGVCLIRKCIAKRWTVDFHLLAGTCCYNSSYSWCDKILHAIVVDVTRFESLIG